MATYQLRVVTPERVVYEDEVNMIVVRSVEGEIGIMAHHVQLITPLLPHIMTIYRTDGKTELLTIGGGFLEVGEDKVIVLADSAETPDAVDVARAERARERALEMLNVSGPDIDLKRAQRALARAENRLKLARR